MFNKIILITIAAAVANANDLQVGNEVEWHHHNFKAAAESHVKAKAEQAKQKEEAAIRRRASQAKAQAEQAKQKKEAAIRRRASQAKAQAEKAAKKRAAAALAAIRLHVSQAKAKAGKAPATHGSSSYCYLRYCNYKTNSDLPKAFCGGKKCTTSAQEKSCKNHWHQYGEHEHRHANPIKCMSPPKAEKAAASTQWKYCAKENQTCGGCEMTNGVGNIMFGESTKGGNMITKTGPGPVQCSLSHFGKDPAPGHLKSCWCKIKQPATAAKKAATKKAAPKKAAPKKAAPKKAAAKKPTAKKAAAKKPTAIIATPVAGCVFPFFYKDFTYYSCTSAYTNGSYTWCSTAAVMTVGSGKWKKCPTVKAVKA